MALPLAIPRTVVQDGLTALGFGIVIGLALGDDRFGVEVEHAPDDGAGDPDTANSSIAGRVEPGREIFVHWMMANDDDWHHYRARHVREGYTDGAWTSWVRAKPMEITFVPTRMPDLPTVTQLDVSFSSSGAAIVSAEAINAVKVYVTVATGSAPSDPTPDTNDGEIDLTGSTHMVVTSVTSIEVGDNIYVKGVAEGLDGALGPVNLIRQRRGHSLKLPPKIAVTATRAGETVTVTMTVYDPTKASGTPQYKIREDDGSLGSWTNWTGGTGTPGVDTSYTRSKTVTASEGKDSEFLGRVPFTDYDGGTDEKQFGFNMGNLEEVSKEIEIPWPQFQMQNSSEVYGSNTVSIGTTQTGVTLNLDTGLVFAVGIVITELAARLWIANSSCVAIAALKRVTDAGSVTALGSVNMGGQATGTFVTRTSSQNETVATGQWYDVWVDLTAITDTTGARCMWIRFKYNTPAYRDTL